MVRFLHQTNREMPLEGDSRFNELSNHFSKGKELKGKTLGVIGFNQTEKEIVKIAIGLGMNVIVTSSTVTENNIELHFFDGQSVNFNIKTQPIEYLLNNSDFITIHERINDEKEICLNDIEKMKNGVGIINVCRAGLINEVDLINAIDSKKVAYAALDVFEKQPKPEIQILMNPEISLSPNISTKTIEIENKIENELIKKIKTFKDKTK
jgi:D-3-phosphoglycerate dehydrogenase